MKRSIILTALLSSCASHEKDPITEVDINDINRLEETISKLEERVSFMEKRSLALEEVLVQVKIQSDWNNALWRKTQKYIEYHGVVINMLDAKERIDKFCKSQIKKKNPKNGVDYVVGVDDNDGWVAGCWVKGNIHYFIEYQEVP